MMFGTVLLKKNDIVPRSYHMNRLALEGLGTRLDNYIYFHIVQRHPSLRQHNKRKNTGFDLSFLLVFVVLITVLTRALTFIFQIRATASKFKKRRTSDSKDPKRKISTP